MTTQDLDHAPPAPLGPDRSTGEAGAVKVAIVTGGTAGIGEVSALELARMGYRVGIVGRDAAKCARVAERIRRDAATPLVDVFVADLSLQAEVRRVGREILDHYDRIDVLLNNAGAMFSPRQETAEGVEKTWALNHMAYFLLTRLLLPRLDATPGARVVSVASDAHRFVHTIYLGDPQMRRWYASWPAYGHSKLANVLFTRELARRLKEAGSTTTANCVHPGVVKTDFMQKKGLTFWLSRLMSRPMSITSEQGADTPIYLATSPEVADVSGRYFYKRQPRKPTIAGRSDKLARKLWDLSESMLLPEGAEATVSPR